MYAYINIPFWHVYDCTQYFHYKNKAISILFINVQQIFCFTKIEFIYSYVSFFIFCFWQANHVCISWWYQFSLRFQEIDILSMHIYMCNQIIMNKRCITQSLAQLFWVAVFVKCICVHVCVGVPNEPYTMKNWYSSWG